MVPSYDKNNEKGNEHCISDYQSLNVLSTKPSKSSTLSPSNSKLLQSLSKHTLPYSSQQLTEWTLGRIGYETKYYFYSCPAHSFWNQQYAHDMIYIYIYRSIRHIQNNSIIHPSWKACWEVCAKRCKGKHFGCWWSNGGKANRTVLENGEDARFVHVFFSIRTLEVEACWVKARYGISLKS